MFLLYRMFLMKYTMLFVIWFVCNSFHLNKWHRLSVMNIILSSNCTFCSSCIQCLRCYQRNILVTEIISRVLMQGTTSNKMNKTQVKRKYRIFFCISCIMFGILRIKAIQHHVRFSSTILCSLYTL